MVSVIIPVYNDSDRLKTCLNALSQQSLPLTNFEVLVVDNNSKEDILAVVKDFGASNVSYLREERIGSYAARNHGLKHAKGDIIAFTDSDCTPQPDWLKEGVACLKGSENPGVAGGSIELFNERAKPGFVEIYEKYTAFRQQENLATGTCVGANWFSYRSVLEQFGGFNAGLKSGGDTELSGRIYKNGYQAIYCAAAVVMHPSRDSYQALGKKYSRLFGGKFDRCKSNKILFSIQYIFRFSYRRLGWNLKKINKIPVKETFALFIVNLYLICMLSKEAILLNLGRKSKRS